MKKRKWLGVPALCVVAAALTLDVVACGGDDDDDNGNGEEASATLALTGEQTELVLDADTAGVLTDLGVEVAPVDPAGPEGLTGGKRRRRLAFGALDPARAHLGERVRRLDRGVQVARQERA
jgi:hypothetical protein